jgi:putative transposase
MPQSLSNVLVHLVFSTKERRPLLHKDRMPELIKVVGGILRDRDGKLLAMNGIPNHVHLLTIFHPKHAASDMLRDIKAISTDWMHEKCGAGDFAWQSGYSAFSVSRSNAAAVEAYIARQESHHRRHSFEDELIALLERHGIEYDKRFVFD